VVRGVFMKAVGSRVEAGTLCVLPLLLLGACATRELPASHSQHSALSSKATPGAALPVTRALDAEPGTGAPETPAHHQHGGHHHGH